MNVHTPQAIDNELCHIELLGAPHCLWRYQVVATGRSLEVAPPSFEVNGVTRPVVASMIEPVGDPLTLSNGTAEHTYACIVDADPDLSVELVLRISPLNPVVRFRYRLRSASPRTLTKEGGRDNLEYLRLSFAGCSLVEVRLSEFDELVHSFRPTEHPVPERAFDHRLALMGPLLVAEDAGHAILVAYEHGSQVPDAFLQYHLAPDRSLALRAAKGSYYAGQILDPEHAYETVWTQIAAVPGNRASLARQYRAYVLRHMTPNVESRQPYIFYNTWNYQERNKWWNGQTFLASMHQERILAEIDVAHRMGIDVFVIDTGWYQKTGDWQVSLERFPDGLRAVRERLEGYGMKLGLWFSPRQAAVSSRIAQQHLDCRVSRGGQVPPPRPVWETEESYDICLVSRYWKAFADELIRLAREVGVTYFKWDAIHQYGCDSPDHWHGTADNSPQERADCYAFELAGYISRVVDRLCAACPEAIVDFDITEGHRSVGLGFLASGKYFIINNGPYYRSLDDPQYAPGGGMGANVYVFPGPARARVCRSPLNYDRWIPSVLYLTHYLPDDPASSQIINLASLILGQNGIWGDLLSVSETGVERFGQVLGLYKEVRGDITEAYPVRSGILGGSPEVHEKVSARTGRGAVAIFAGAAGQYVYVTRNRVADTWWASEGVTLSRDQAGRARLEVTLERPGAVLALFGVGEGREQAWPDAS
jgi:alpha-galactosidase